MHHFTPFGEVHMPVSKHYFFKLKKLWKMIIVQAALHINLLKFKSSQSTADQLIQRHRSSCSSCYPAHWYFLLWLCIWWYQKFTFINVHYLNLCFYMCCFITMAWFDIEYREASALLSMSWCRKHKWSIRWHNLTKFAYISIYCALLQNKIYH